MKNFILIFIFLFILSGCSLGGVGFNASPGDNVPQASPRFFSQSGGIVSINDEFDGFNTGTFTQGGGIRATSTVNASETLLATDFDIENRIEYTMNLSSTTLTITASSSLASFVPNAGNHRAIDIKNSTSTSGIILTIAAGTGTIIHNATSTLAIKPGDFATLEFKRKTNTDIDIFFNIYQ